MQQVEIEKERLRAIEEPLLKWFQENKRSLMWRDDPTPYHVWVSEIMLQQTRVEAVKGYYVRFLKELPDVFALANAKEEELLKLWEGLGYYNRVRNMQKAARTIVEQYQGRIPDCYEELIRLCGIGSYTAGAIASIAYGQRVPAVDGNVFRVLTRICADDTDIMMPAFRKNLETVLKEVMSENSPGMYNQALMELGAIVCVPNGPAKCTECPLNQLCRAYELDRVYDYPVKSPKRDRTIEEKTVFLIQDGSYAVLHKRPEQGLLAGLYEFVNTKGHLDETDAIAFLQREGFDPLFIERQSDARHIFTHKEWLMRVYLVKIAEQIEIPKKYVYATSAQMKSYYPVPSAFRAVKELIGDRF